MRSRSSFLDRRFHVLGGSLPAPVALLIGATLVCSIAGAQIVGVAASGALSPALLLRGELWRLVTWAFFEPDAIGLIFGALALFWFGGDLVRIWGPVRFLWNYLGLAAAAACVTTVLALVWPELWLQRFIGVWPVVSALIIAWACAFPSRQLLFYFVVPLSGRNLVYATLGGTLLFALLGGGLARFVPHFAAQLVSLLAMRGSPFGQLWARLRFELAYRGWRRRSRGLHEVPRPPRDETTRWYH